LAKQGVHLLVSDEFGVKGRLLLTQAPLDAPYRARVNSLCRLIDACTWEIDLAAKLITQRLARHEGYRVIQQLPGVGPMLAAVLVAEIGDVHRFTSARHLCSWAGLTPRHRESDTKVHRGRVTKQGSPLLRWAAIEAVQKMPADAGWLVSTKTAIAERRGRQIATVAVARKLLTLVFYGLRDGHIRCLTTESG
jgi:transposase